MKTIQLRLDDNAEKVLQYIADKYHTSLGVILAEAIDEYYRDEIEEYERQKNER